MKFKPMHLYGIITAVIIVFLSYIVFSEKADETTRDITKKQMPDDAIHKKFHQDMMSNLDNSDSPEEVKKKIEALKKDVEANPNDTLKMREYAEFLTTSHNYDEALSCYQKILDKDKNRKDVYFGITYIYYSQGNSAKAEEVAMQMLEMFPDDPMVNYNAGAIEAAKGNYEKAREIWTKLIQNFPNDKTSELAKKSIERLK